MLIRMPNLPFKNLNALKLDKCSVFSPQSLSKIYLYERFYPRVNIFLVGELPKVAICVGWGDPAPPRQPV